jgi:hypothetical protein
MLTWISGRAPIAGGTCRSPAPATVRDLAKAERINEFYLGRILRLTLLSPSIIEAILEGRQPNSLASGTSKSKC